MRSVRSSRTGSETLALDQVRAGLLGESGQHVVELRARTREAVVGKLFQLGPEELEGLLAAAVGAQAAVVDPARFLADVDAEADQLLGGARREAVAAHLVARERGLLQEGDAEALVGQPLRRGGPARACADDDDVRFDHRLRCALLGHRITPLTQRPAAPITGSV